MNSNGVGRLLNEYIDGKCTTRKNELVHEVLNHENRRVLFGLNSAKMERMLRAGIEIFPTIIPQYYAVAEDRRMDDPTLGKLWSEFLPLSQFILERKNSSDTFVLGIAGGPGVGKTTLAAMLELSLECIGKEHVVRISLEDFYYPPNIRLEKGFPWRAPPGTHDLELAQQVLSHIVNSDPVIEIPRYDMEIDDRTEPEIVTGMIDFCIFEGWIVGKRDEGYETLSQFLDYLIFLDADIEMLRRGRLEREAKIRSETQGQKGFSEEFMKAYWDKALGPGVREWVLPIRDYANMVIEIGENHEFKRIYI